MVIILILGSTIKEVYKNDTKAALVSFCYAISRTTLQLKRVASEIYLINMALNPRGRGKAYTFGTFINLPFIYRRSSQRE